jgi:hypothetical protein
MFTLCGSNSLAMLTVVMNLSSLVHCLQDLELLMFIYILFEHGLYLSSLVHYLPLSMKASPSPCRLAVMEWVDDGRS